MATKKNMKEWYGKCCYYCSPRTLAMGNDSDGGGSIVYVPQASG